MLFNEFTICFVFFSCLVLEYPLIETTKDSFGPLKKKKERKKERKMNQKGCNRWSERETKLLEEVRVILADEIAEAGQFAEVVGDRGIMKFIRGHGELDKIVTMYRNYLHWRKEVGADAIRERIRLENLNKPSLFPNGEGFLEMSEQIIIAADACDLEGNPIAFETFDFSPRYAQL